MIVIACLGDFVVAWAIYFAIRFAVGSATPYVPLLGSLRLSFGSILVAQGIHVMPAFLILQKENNDFREGTGAAEECKN